MKHQQGFTLVELVLVIVVTGVMAVYAVPRLLDANAWKLRAFADDLQSSVAATQRLALAQRREVRVAFSGGDVQFNYMAGAVVGDVARASLACPTTVPTCISGAAGQSVLFNAANDGTAATSTGSALTITVGDGGSNAYAYSLENFTGLMRRLP